MASVFTKSKASTLAKIAALPRYRSPKDLLNQPHLSYDLQIGQIDKAVPFKDGQYIANEHYQLCKSSVFLREQYRQSQKPQSRQKIASKHYKLWNNYLGHWLNKPIAKLSQEQKQRVYEAMLTAKQRNEERLALHRFIKFGYEYAQAFKMDMPINPVVAMKMVHPHFGYLNNIPNLSHFKYTHDQIFNLISQFIVASEIREKGYTLHSSQMVSFIFWKILSQGKAQLQTQEFLNLLKVFKFNLSKQDYQEQLSYSIKEGQIVEGEGLVRFDVLRQIFLDRDL